MRVRTAEHAEQNRVYVHTKETEKKTHDQPPATTHMPTGKTITKLETLHIDTRW